MRARGGAVRAVPDLVAAEAAGGERADAGDRARDPGGRRCVPAEAVHDDRGGRDRAVLPPRLLQRARVGDRLRLPDRRRVLGGRRLHRDERRRPLERPHRGGRARGPPARVPGRVPRGLRDRPARRRARAARRRRLLLGADRLDRQQPRVGRRRPHRARLRRLPHLRLRPSGRRHLHEGGGRRRRPRREDRGGHPRGRPAQPGRDRRQRRRQRRRLRRHGRRPLRDVRRHRRRGDAARDPVRGDEPLALPACPRRHLDPLLGRRDVLHASREREERDHQRALPQRARRVRALRRRLHPRDDGLRRRRVQLLEPVRRRAHRAGGDVPARRDHRVLHRHALAAGEGDRARLPDGPRDEHHLGPRDRDAGDGAAGARDRGRRRGRVLHRGRGAVRDRRRRHGAALADRPHRRAGRVRPGDGQRGRDRRDGRPARVRARDHRPARRRRQHDEGGDEGLRDRVGRPRRARPLRRVRPRAGGGGAERLVRAQRPLGHRRALRRRPDAVPLRLARDAGGRDASAARSWRRCAASSGRTRGSWRALPGPTTRARSRS